MSYPTYSDLELEIQQLEIENKKLKSDLAFERTMLDNVKAEYESQVNIIERLEKENKKLKAQIEKMSGIWLASVAPTVILED